MTVYTADADLAAMFATPRYVVKGGALVVEEGQLRRAPAGRGCTCGPRTTRRSSARLRDYFERYATVSFDNYPVALAAGRSRMPLVPTVGTPAMTVEIRGVFIEDTFAEAFGMRAARLVITARNLDGRAKRRSS